jgi:hypothetical protein
MPLPTGERSPVGKGFETVVNAVAPLSIVPVYGVTELNAPSCPKKPVFMEMML